MPTTSTATRRSRSPPSRGRPHISTHDCVPAPDTVIFYLKKPDQSFLQSGPSSPPVARCLHGAGVPVADRLLDLQRLIEVHDLGVVVTGDGAVEALGVLQPAHPRILPARTLVGVDDDVAGEVPAIGPCDQIRRRQSVTGLLVVAVVDRPDTGHVDAAE